MNTEELKAYLNQVLMSISTTMDQQFTVQQETLKFSAINAIYSAANTQALKYITLVS